MSALAPRPSRAALARVLQSLLQAERTSARGQRGGHDHRSTLPVRPWSDEVGIRGQGVLDLGCDSLEALWLSSAACEMFDLAKADRHSILLGSDRFGEWLDVIDRAWCDGLGTIVFSTSGTTGQPKRSTHNLQDLDAEAKHFAGMFAGCRRVLSFVPAHHLYGFIFTALLPDRLGVNVLDIDAATQALAAPQAGDLIVAFPERWAWIERIVRHWPADVHGVTSTAPCPPALIDGLLAANLTDLTEVYGSSETGGIATRRRPATTYQLLPRWMFAGDGDDALVDATGKYASLPDTIVRSGDRVFTVGDRRDGAVQVGGINVYPDRVAAALCERPGVREAAVRLMRRDEGLRLKAFVVSDGSVAEEALREALGGWIEQALEVPARPCAFRFGCTLPRNALGKLADW